MMTFLPFENFKKCAEVLDKRRCWKQVIEASQIIDCLEGKKVGWRNHPVVKMWVGYEKELKHYYNIFLDHCLKVHKIKTQMWYKDCYYSYGVKSEYHGNYFVDNQIPSWERNKPFWLGQDPFHRAMRSRLIEKDPNFYGSKFLDKDKGYNDSKYWWPVMEDKTFRII
jgi:hypothetical protein